MRQTTKLKELFARREAIMVPGAPNAMFAKIVERQGFEAVYVTGAGIANMHLGVPDIGLTTVSEVAQVTAAISDATELPLIVDADTGFGNALNMVRTIRLLERAGAAGIQIEDQIFPKKCGHFSGKDVISAAEMVQKIKAAVDSRRDSDLQIIARTDARAVEGLNDALDRAAAYIEAGADATFVEAPLSFEELASIPSRLAVPQLANIVYGGKTPDLGQEKLKELGFSVILYANLILQASIRTANEALSLLKSHRSVDGAAHLLASFVERQQTVNKLTWDELEDRYRH